jgi:hypothetical protein
MKLLVWKGMYIYGLACSPRSGRKLGRIQLWASFMSLLQLYYNYNRESKVPDTPVPHSEWTREVHPERNLSVRIGAEANVALVKRQL